MFCRVYKASTASGPPIQTHFGYQTVPVEHKAAKVAEVFRNVAPRYDLMNDLMSFGLHRLWKRYLILLSRVRKGQVVLDCAGGTGDLTRHLARQAGVDGHVVLADVNEAMLQQGRNKLLDSGICHPTSIVQCTAESLPFPMDTFDCAIMAFGLRNVTNKDRALQNLFSVLKPGGQCLILEFSKLEWSLFQPFYDAYSFRVLPWLGEKVVGDRASYQYLAESIRMHPSQEDLKTMMVHAGFENCEYHNLMGGIVAIHRGYKCV